MLNVNQGVNFILLPCYTKLMLILMAFSNPIPEWEKAAKLSFTESRKYIFPWHAATAFFSHSSLKVTLSQRTVFSNQSPLRLYFVKLCCWVLSLPLLTGDIVEVWDVEWVLKECRAMEWNRGILCLQGKGGHLQMIYLGQEWIRR